MLAQRKRQVRLLQLVISFVRAHCSSYQKAYDPVFVGELESGDDKWMTWHARMISPPHTLPQELLDKIVDNVFDDHSTLLACSLAARPFLPATRYHLFSQSVVRLDCLDKLGELRTAHCSTIFHGIRHLNIAIDE
jgi:hypothetical protein